MGNYNEDEPVPQYSDGIDTGGNDITIEVCLLSTSCMVSKLCLSGIKAYDRLLGMGMPDMKLWFSKFCN